MSAATPATLPVAQALEHAASRNTALAKPTRRACGERREQILRTLAQMLGENPERRVTTAALAKRVQVSEAALYRHFATKGQLLEALLTGLEAQFAQSVASSDAKNLHGTHRIEYLLTALVRHTEEEPGLARLLISDEVSVNEPRLQGRISQFLDTIESSLQRPFSQLHPTDPLRPEQGAERARLATAMLLGLWVRWVRSGFRLRPATVLPGQLEWLLA